MSFVVRRLEYPVQILLGDPAAVVTHSDEQVLSHVEALDLRIRGVRYREILGRDLYHPTVRHRVAGVHEEIEQDLVDLCIRVAFELLRVLRDVKLCGDVLRERVPGNRPHLLGNFGDIQRDTSPTDAAGKGQHLPDEERTALGALIDGIDDRLRPLVAACPHQEFGAHQDRGKQVVEVMRDAACECAYAFQPLDAQELSLRLFRAVMSVSIVRIAVGWPFESRPSVQRQSRISDSPDLAFFSNSPIHSSSANTALHASSYSWQSIPRSSG